jgi:hypothetical protein
MPASRFAAWADGLTKIGVTGVTEVTEPQNPRVSMSLGNSFQVTRAEEEKVTRVTSPTATMEVTPVAQRAIPGLPTKPIDDHCINPGNPSYAVVGMACASPQLFNDPGSWHDLYQERAAHREFDGDHPRAEAEELAFNELVVAWHALHGRRWPDWQCAGCDQPIGELPSLGLADRNRVHFAQPDCLIRFGERWRGEAAAGLRLLGIERPGGFECP